MAVLLHIETSTSVCSAALSQDAVCLLQRIDFQGFNHAKMLPTFLEEILNFAKKEGKKIDAVAVSAGPGSYTGLRIGVSSAKGLCFGLNVPLIAVDTLAVLAENFLAKNAVSDELLCPMIDARRMEVYSAIYLKNLTKFSEIGANIIDENSFSQILENRKICFFGNGANKCKTVIKSGNALFFDGVFPTAENMISLAEKAFFNQEFQDVAYFEPFYLKDFIATVPKEKLRNFNK